HHLQVAQLQFHNFDVRPNGRCKEALQPRPVRRTDPVYAIKGDQSPAQPAASSGSMTGTAPDPVHGTRRVAHTTLPSLTGVLPHVTLIASTSSSPRPAPQPIRGTAGLPSRTETCRRRWRINMLNSNIPPTCRTALLTSSQ